MLLLWHCGKCRDLSLRSLTFLLVVERDATSPSPCLVGTAVWRGGDFCVANFWHLFLMVNKGLVNQSRSVGWLFWV